MKHVLKNNLSKMTFKCQWIRGNTNSKTFSGVCKCSSSYIGMDCSHAKSIPPINLTLPESGLCKTSQRACAKTNIFGHFQSETVMAKLEEFQVTKLFADF